MGLTYLAGASRLPIADYDGRRGLARIGFYTLRSSSGGVFSYLYREIFVEGIYHFEPRRAEPLILDCGSNLGMSILYFKAACPGARVIGFEADPAIFAVLRQNVAENELSDVILVNGALANREGTLAFYSDDKMEGRLGKYEANPPLGSLTRQVPCVRLRNYLTEPVDLLKMDIEGAEGEVLRDTEDRLHFVRELVVEYHHGLTPEPLHEILALLHRQNFEYTVKGRRTNGYRWNQLIYARRRDMAPSPYLLSN